MKSKNSGRKNAANEPSAHQQVLRDNLLQAINEAAVLLFTTKKNENIEPLIMSSIEIIGRSINAHRIHLWQIEDTDKLQFKHIYNWVSKRGKRYVKIPMGSVIGLPKWKSKFMRSKFIGGPISTLTPEEQKYFKAFDIKSVFMIPLFLNENLWGLFSIDDCECERSFSNKEIAFFRTASLMMASLINRHTLEMEITDENKRNMLMLDTAPLCTQIWSRDLTTIDCNEAGVKLYGFKNKQEYVDRFLECCSPKYQPDGRRSDEKTLSLVNKAFEEGICVFDWTHQIPATGVVFPVEVTLVRGQYRNEDVVIGYTRDLREQEKMLANIEYRDRLLQSVNQAAVLLFNSDFEILKETLTKSISIIAETAGIDGVHLWRNKTINDALYCYQLFEWPPEKTRFVDGVHYSYNDIIPGWEETLSKGNYINDIVRNLSKKEQEHLKGILSILIVPVFIEEEFWGFAGFDYFYKERIFSKEEKSVLHSASILIANAFVLNETILNLRDVSSELEFALKKANAASKAKGDFLSNMSHEMRTPMNAIIGMTVIGRKAENIEEKNTALKKIEDASSHLLGVINNILDMAKIEADKLEITPVEFHFGKMLQRVLSIINFRTNEKHQTLIINVDEKIPSYIIGDDHRLIQVLTNLLSNAVKFTPEKGQIHLNAYLISEISDECVICIEVIDNGIGIPPEQQVKLFVAFEQGQGGISREYGGTGLGLALSKRIVQLMGGKIWVESELGQGSTFAFTIKVRSSNKTHETDAAAKEHHSGKSSANAKEFEGKRALVAEDIDINREILIMLLENSGLVIDCAENGKKALDMVTSDPEKYDIVFMDLQMPQMDGLEATRSIRAQPHARLKKLPIIAMTANVFKEDVDACLAAGINDHLGKPLDLEKILEKLRIYLG